MGLFLLALITLFALIYSCGAPKSSNPTSTKVPGQSNPTGEPAAMQTAENAKGPTQLPEVSPAGTNTGVGNIRENGNIKIGLSYVKRTSYLPTALGDMDDNVGAGNEVILAFFDFYNDSNSLEEVSPRDITCYVDGIKAKEVESYIKVECDGVKQFYQEDIIGHARLMSVQDFEVPTGWSEIKLFYGSNCIWTVHQDDVHSENFTMKSMYGDAVPIENATKSGTMIFSDGYEIIYQGTSMYMYSDIFAGSLPYVIFKFRINNTGSAVLDYNLVGHEMSAYQNAYFLGDASFILDDKIDNYINIFNVDSIEPGMSANVYIAFECFEENGSFVMVYDDGYITHDIRGLVFAEIE